MDMFRFSLCDFGHTVNHTIFCSGEGTPTQQNTQCCNTSYDRAPEFAAGQVNLVDGPRGERARRVVARAALEQSA